MQLALVSIAFVTLVMYGEKPKVQSDAHEHSPANAVQEPSGQTSPAVIVVNQDHSERKSNDHPNKPPNYLSRLFGPENLPNIALVGVGIAGIIMALCTLSVLRRQTDDIVNSQRSWVMVDIEWQKGAHIFEGTSSEGAQNVGIYVDYVCRNMGKSFAQITDKGYVLKIVNILPWEPDFASIDDFHHTTEYLAPDSASHYLLSGISCDGSRRNRLMVIYGRAKYRDVYGEHETRFGYLVTSMGNLDRLPASDYPEYNKHT